MTSARVCDQSHMVGDRSHISSPFFIRYWGSDQTCDRSHISSPFFIRYWGSDWSCDWSWDRSHITGSLLSGFGFECCMNNLMLTSTTKDTYNCGSLAMETHNCGVFGHGSHDHHCRDPWPNPKRSMAMGLVSMVRDPRVVNLIRTTAIGLLSHDHLHVDDFFSNLNGNGIIDQHNIWF